MVEKEVEAAFIDEGETDVHEPQINAEQDIETMAEKEANTALVGEGEPHGKTVGDTTSETPFVETGASERRPELVHLQLLRECFSRNLEERISETNSRSWERVEAAIAHSTETEMRHGLVSSYDKCWFLQLATPGSWVYNDHIQECFRGFLELQKAYPYIMSQDVSLMDADFHQLVASAFLEGGKCNIGNLMPWARAEYSSWPTVPMNKAKLILIPFHINSHWVLLKFVVKIRKVSVLDSDQSADSTGQKLFEAIKPLALMVPLMLAELGVTSALKTPWDISRRSEFPTQKKSGECGVYVIAAAALTMSEGNAYKLNDEKVEAFRRFCTCCIWDKFWSLD